MDGGQVWESLSIDEQSFGAEVGVVSEPAQGVAIGVDAVLGYQAEEDSDAVAGADMTLSQDGSH